MFIAEAPQNDMPERLDPGLRQVFRDFEMALKAIGGIAIAEGLIFTGRARHQADAGIRQSKRILMPLHDALLRRKATEQGILLTGRGDVDRQIAIFELVIPAYPRAEGPCQQLAAEAQAEHWL